MTDHTSSSEMNAYSQGPQEMPAYHPGETGRTVPDMKAISVGHTRRNVQNMQAIDPKDPVANVLPLIPENEKWFMDMLEDEGDVREKLESDMKGLEKNQRAIWS